MTTKNPHIKNSPEKDPPKDPKDRPSGKDLNDDTPYWDQPESGAMR